MPIRPILITANCLCLSLSSLSSAQTIDFETLPSGASTTDNMLIDAQYEAEYGVRFSLVDRVTGAPAGFPRIAKVGSPLTAFVSCGGDDTPDSGLGVGDSFLTDDGALGVTSNLRVDYFSPVSQASGVILDVDTRSSDPGALEVWKVKALNSSGVRIESITIQAFKGPDEPGCEGYNGPGDGSARGFSFSRANADIAAVEFEYIGTAKGGSVGLAFDNFSPATAVEELQVDLFTVSDQPTCRGDGVMLEARSSGGFSDQSIRWESRESESDPWTVVPTLESFAASIFVTQDNIQLRVVVSDGSTEAASDPLTFNVNERAVTLQTGGEHIIENAALYLFDSIDADEVWGDEPTSFDNDEIETVSEGVHILPMLTNNGAHLAVIYNTTGGSTPGTALTEVVTLGFEPDLIFLDDPDDPMYNDTYTEELLAPGMKRFTLDQTWAGDKTDGFIIGPMVDSGSFTITITESSGLSTGFIFRGDGEPVPFDFTNGMELTLENSCNSSCPADLTMDSTLDFFDISAFLSGYTNTDPIADFNEDGVYDFFDISSFLTAFSDGCP